MARKHQEEPPKGLAPWLATFGDLMNLLLCFFVLLFSMSNVDAEKLEAVSQSFQQTFSIFPAGAMSVGDGLLVGNGVSQLNELDKYINSTGKTAETTAETTEGKDVMSEATEKQLAESEKLAEQVTETIIEEGMQDKINVQFTSQYVLLTLNGALVFDSGKSDVKEEAKPVLDKVGKILMKYGQSVIEIEGHTDNIPIHNSQFANNNELSGARALAVFDYFMQTTSLDPALIKCSGRGEYVPVADNSLPEGRAKNRRVEIKIYHSLSNY